MSSIVSLHVNNVSKNISLVFDIDQIVDKTSFGDFGNGTNFLVGTNLEETKHFSAKDCLL